MWTALTSVVSWVGRRFVYWGLTGVASVFTGFIGPAIMGVASFIGGILTAIGEIIAAMSKSPEGRWGLALIVALCLGSYGRWHYIQQGRAEGYHSGHVAGVASVKPKIITQICPPAKKAR